MDAETKQALEASKEVVDEIQAIISAMPEKQQRSVQIYHDAFVKMVNNDEDAKMAFVLVGAELQVASFN